MYDLMGKLWSCGFVMCVSLPPNNSMMTYSPRAVGSTSAWSPTVMHRTKKDWVRPRTLTSELTGNILRLGGGGGVTRFYLNVETT